MLNYLTNVPISGITPSRSHMHTFKVKNMPSSGNRAELVTTQLLSTSEIDKSEARVSSGLEMTEANKTKLRTALSQGAASSMPTDAMSEPSKQMSEKMSETKPDDLVRHSETGSMNQ